MLELLRDGTYIRYWLAVVVSFLGDAIAKVTLIYLAATVTDAPVLFIALVVIAQLLPSSVLGAFVGPLADRISPRVLMVGADLARVLMVLAMIPAQHSEGLLLALIVLEGTGKAVFETARITAIPKIVGKHSIPSAIALFQSTNHTVNLVGPALGGLLIAVSNVSVALTIDALTFVVSAALLGSMAVLRDAPKSSAAREPYWRSLGEGVRGVLQVPTLRFLAIFLVPAMLVLGLFTSNLNAQLLEVFELPASQFGLTLAVFGGGSVLGALLGPRLVRRYSSAALLVASAASFGVTLMLLIPADWLTDLLGLAAIMLWCLLAGLTSGLFQVPIAHTLLRDLPEHLRGRGVGLLNAAIVTFTILGVGAGALMANLTGIANSIILAGLALLIAAALLIPPARRPALR